MKETELGDWLFQREEPRRRKSPSAYLHLPFSPKLGRRVRIYTPVAYDHWVTVEIDPTITIYNEEPPECLIPMCGKLRRVSFVMACRRNNGELFVRRIIPAQNNNDGEFEEAISEWASKAGILSESVLEASLSADSLYLENWKNLLQFVDIARDEITVTLQTCIHEFVCKNPGAPLASVQAYHSDNDPSILVAIIATLLMNRQIRADLKRKTIDRNLALYPSND